MLWGLDSSAPPSLRELAMIVDRGYRFYCGYVGGDTPYVWTYDDIKSVTTAGLSFNPIWVAPLGSPNEAQGDRDGADCVAALKQRLLGEAVTLDVENGAVPRDYVVAFVSQLNAVGCTVCLYGSNPTLISLGQPEIVDSVWLAYWAAFVPVPPRAPYDWDMWQFAAGGQADLNVARDDFRFASVG